MAEIIGGIDVSAWSDAQKKALRDALAAKTAAEAEVTTAAAARTARENAPDEVIRRMQAEADAAKHEAADVKAFEDAETKHGRGRVAMVRTVEGAIILRAMTLAETDAAEARAAQLTAIPERTAAHREALLDSVLHPPRVEVKARTEKFPGLWGVLYAARDRLIEGVEAEVEGKAVISISKPAKR